MSNIINNDKVLVVKNLLQIQIHPVIRKEWLRTNLISTRLYNVTFMIRFVYNPTPHHLLLPSASAI